VELNRRFDHFLRSNGIRLEEQGVQLQLKDSDCRGMIATRPFREGVTVCSIPMKTFTLSSEKLMTQSSFLQTLKPPSFEEVRREMSHHSVRDPVLHQQMHLALLVAGERMNPNSPFQPYFDLLPHPAVDDGAVIGLHKDVLNPMQLLEWDDHQRLFVSVCRALCLRWQKAGSHPPPPEVVYWAFRTVLSRMHLLPDRGLQLGDEENCGGGKKPLNYSALFTLRQIGTQESLVKRLQSTFKAMMTSDSLGAEDYRLMPTLVPVVDMASHLASGNVSVEVQPRPKVGSCVELQAVSAIKEGEAIGLCMNRSQSIAFTLYRFGFLPI
jgi:hypothetical protein